MEIGEEIEVELLEENWDLVNFEAAYDQPLINVEETAIDQSMEFWLQEDEPIKRLKAKLIKITPQNVDFLYHTDDTCQAYAKHYSNTVIGDKIDVVVKDEEKELEPFEPGSDEYIAIKEENQEISSLIDEFNAKINERGKDINNVFHAIVSHNIRFARSIHKKKRDAIIDGKRRMALYELNMKTVHELTHPTQGWTKWIQDTFVSDRMKDMTRDEFLFEYDPYIDPTSGKILNENLQHLRVHIQEEQILFIKMFDRAPINPILDLLFYKKWIYYFTQMAARIRGVPPPIVKVGTPEAHPPINKYPGILKKVSKRAAKFKNWDAAAIPYNWEVKFWEGGTPQDFTVHLEWINKRIIFALMGVQGIFEAQSGDEFGRGVIQATWLRGIKASRRKIEARFVPIWEEYLESIGKHKKLKVNWSPLKEELSKMEIHTIISALMITQTVFKDTNEIRELYRKHAILDLEPLSEEDILAMQEAMPGEEDEEGGEGEEDGEELPKPPIANPNQVYLQKMEDRIREKIYRSKLEGEETTDIIKIFKEEFDGAFGLDITTFGSLQMYEDIKPATPFWKVIRKSKEKRKRKGTGELKKHFEQLRERLSN